MHRKRVAGGINASSVELGTSLVSRVHESTSHVVVTSAVFCTPLLIPQLLRSRPRRAENIDFDTCVSRILHAAHHWTQCCRVRVVFGRPDLQGISTTNHSKMISALPAKSRCQASEQPLSGLCNILASLNITKWVRNLVQRHN